MFRVGQPGVPSSSAGAEPGSQGDGWNLRRGLCSPLGSQRWQCPRLVKCPYIRSLLRLGEALKSPLPLPPTVSPARLAGLHYPFGDYPPLWVISEAFASWLTSPGHPESSSLTIMRCVLGECKSI